MHCSALPSKDLAVEWKWWKQSGFRENQVTKSAVCRCLREFFFVFFSKSDALKNFAFFVSAHEEKKKRRQMKNSKRTPLGQN